MRSDDLGRYEFAYAVSQVHSGVYLLLESYQASCVRVASTCYKRLVDGKKLIWKRRYHDFQPR